MNKMPQKNKPLVSIIMGSQSDYSTMRYAEEVLKNSELDLKQKLYPLTEHQKDYMNMLAKQKEIIFL